MRKRSLAPSTACRLKRSRRCFSPRATTFRSPFARRFPGSSIRCRCQGASASILRWTSPGRRGLDRTSNGWRRSTTTSTRGAPNPSMSRSDLLARSAGRRVAAGLRRNPPEDCSPWRVVDRFSHPDGTRPRRPGACQSVRHRVPRPYVEPRDRGRDREAALITRPFVGRPQEPAMTSPATTVAACSFRSRARKSSRFPMTGPRAY